MGNVLPVVGGVLSGVSDLFNSISSVWSMKKGLEQQERAWMREDNAVQRRVADLKAAGLSPVLAAGSAAQASGPIQVGTPTMQSTGISKAVELMRMKADIAQTEANKQMILANTNKANVEALKAQAEIKSLEKTMLRQDIDNAIRSGDWNIIKRMQSNGVRSDATGTVSQLGQAASALQSVIPKIGSSPVVSAVVEEAGKTIFPKKIGELVWDDKRRRYVQDSSSGTQAIRSEKNR